ncbi:hypothetical protein FIV34_18615 [Luteibacter pinisoli]|uniref:Uncharacterized protein n=1 Tax=Luteibacter pinisoli TaxID=2589080 RepID=A0A4Y5ZA50_9GAMM|nr:hypothetical protein [Luteibacter pinisoli]QDE41073.1 hypothetical protein FIV34_18615 [Luteibacter pinisoli]
MSHDANPGKRPLLTRLRERLVSRGAVHVDVDAGVIVSTPGLFRMRDVPLARVSRVEAGNRDTPAWDTVFLFFHVDGEDTLVLSEHDVGFPAMVRALRETFPGIEGWESAVPPVKFQLTSVNLWQREPVAEVLGDVDGDGAGTGA